ncbi:DUF5610 domain-containing protein [Thiomicrorhabdus lithotrophica]|uniref:DUF5610 domain-containing protein n=1 Tax=Thiomicrorhabdus lithotrophica TaxID=2949997 RepID=A0ABY8CGD3_9GAMM|nr:DUF5610 domain-containing protein [Thiomicrorhabdus lithotrophica]WEJ63508.1 DUF5610 domain-containing protein [Thiomicrorhabdus lithotrophica]
MAIDTKNLGSIQAYQKLAGLAPEQANPNNNGKRIHGQPELPEQVSVQASQMTIRNERQASLVAHLFGDGQTAETHSLKLTFQAAIEKINEVLMAEMPQSEEGETQTAPITEEALKEQGGMDYWTPENTAKRIVEGATAFISGFQAAHPELEGEELINKFLEVVGGGVNQGFDEAKGILGDLDVLKGNIADNIATTFQLVQDGMQSFKNQFLGITDGLTETANPSPVNEIENN